MTTTRRPHLPQVAVESEDLLDLRRQVRAFLDEEFGSGRITPQVDSWLTGWDEEVTRRLAARGWLG
ncbi:MAG: acyl-CoA dehydrogenase family protein, partial [Actinomycetes bacterium]